MSDSIPPTHAIRLYRPGDRAAVRDICAKCSWLGSYEPDRIIDDWIWAEYWTRYFTDGEPQHTWVVERTSDGAVVGYLSGTADVSRVEHYTPRLLPGIVWRVIRKRLLRRAAGRRAIISMLRSLLRGELSLPRVVRREFPATCHMNILPEARGRGLGSRMHKLFMERMKSLGVRGVHAHPMSINPVMPGFLSARGFTMVDSHPLTAFAFADPQAIDLQTWVRAI